MSIESQGEIQSPKRVKIYYDKQSDELTFVNRKHITSKPVVVVNVPSDTRRDGDCVVLPDHPNACFKNRRVSPLELYIRANVGWGDLSVSEVNIHGMHTFSMHGKPKAASKGGAA